MDRWIDGSHTHTHTHTHTLLKGRMVDFLRTRSAKDTKFVLTLIDAKYISFNEIYKSPNINSTFSSSQVDISNVNNVP